VTTPPIAGPQGEGASPSERPLLQIDDLGVAFPSDRGPIHAVRDVTLSIARGEIVALVGESGSGKSVTALTLLGLTRGPGVKITGAARFSDVDLIGAPDAVLRTVRGKRVSMVFQDPMSSLNPVLRIGEQVAEQIRAHEHIGKAEARKRSIDALTEVGIPRAAERVDSYPHEFSGGMRQRVMIAMALSCSPELLIADEPTTALDVTVQAQILDLILRLRDERGMSVLLVTHDLGVVAEAADSVAVMYGGRIVEQADVETLFEDPRHPYTWGLIGSIPPLSGARPDRLPTIAGTPPSPRSLPAGCSFRARCPHAFEQCAELPPLASTGNGHWDRCWLPLDRKRALRAGADGRIGLQHEAAPDAAAATAEEGAA
jgi:oligopeptide/dipeptide ABC transporter ATP-binding protein